MMPKTVIIGNSLVVQWAGLRSFTAVGPVSIPGQGTKIPHAVCNQKSKNKTVIAMGGEYKCRAFKRSVT